MHDSWLVVDAALEVKEEKASYALNNKLSFSDAAFYSLALFVLWFTVSLAREAKLKWEGGKTEKKNWEGGRKWEEKDRNTDRKMR